MNKLSCQYEIEYSFRLLAATSILINLYICYCLKFMAKSALQLWSSVHANFRRFSANRQPANVQELENVEPPAKLINDITNKQVVKAHNYI